MTDTPSGRANKKNAALSTGPKTNAGKAKSSTNALSHGVLSSKLLLEGESTDDYQNLLSSLLAELSPVGTMEQLLVERMAVSIWRQRRLVGAESAAIAEQQSLSEFGALFRIRAMAGLQPSDDEWVKAIVTDLPEAELFSERISQLERLRDSGADIATVRKSYADLWNTLCDAAEVDTSRGNSVAAQCEEVQVFLNGTYGSLAQWIDQSLYDNRQTFQLVRAAHTVRAALSVPAQADVLSRYQTALDNEWFKCLRALREAQKFRLDQAAFNATPISTNEG